MNDPAVPAVNVVLLALVIAGAALRVDGQREALGRVGPTPFAAVIVNG